MWGSYWLWLWRLFCSLWFWLSQLIYFSLQKVHCKNTSSTAFWRVLRCNLLVVLVLMLLLPSWTFLMIVSFLFSNALILALTANPLAWLAIAVFVFKILNVGPYIFNVHSESLTFPHYHIRITMLTSAPIISIGCLLAFSIYTHCPYLAAQSYLIQAWTIW